MSENESSSSITTSHNNVMTPYRGVSGHAQEYRHTPTGISSRRPQPFNKALGLFRLSIDTL